jgi:hypothetical protein
MRLISWSPFRIHANAGLHAPAAMGLGGRHEVRQQQPRALSEDTGLQSRPTTDGSIEVPTTDAHCHPWQPTAAPRTALLLPLASEHQQCGRMVHGIARYGALAVESCGAGPGEARTGAGYRRPQEGPREARPEGPARRGTCPRERGRAGETQEISPEH